jgi:hypothetical protein
VVEGSKRRSGVGKAFESVKQIVSGVKGPGSPSKDGAPPLSFSSPPVNRAMVVIPVRQKRPMPISPPRIETSLTVTEPTMGPPSSSSPSTRSIVPSAFSVESSGSRKRSRNNEYEVLRLRRDLSASQEELSLVRRQYAAYREATDSYIDLLHREIDGPSDEEPSFKGKGKGRAM